MSCHFAHESSCLHDLSMKRNHRDSTFPEIVQNTPHEILRQDSPDQEIHSYRLPKNPTEPTERVRDRQAHPQHQNSSSKKFPCQLRHQWPYPSTLAESRRHKPSYSDRHQQSRHKCQSHQKSRRGEHFLKLSRTPSRNLREQAASQSNRWFAMLANYENQLVKYPTYVPSQ